jgi:hypothetical protein
VGRIKSPHPLDQSPRRPMLIKTKNREDAYRAIINVWLKDKTLYCNNCGKPFDPLKDNPMCCEEPHIGKNIDHCMGIIKQNKELMKVRKNEFASNDDKNIRWGLSLPISLFYTIDNWKKGQGMKGLFREDGEITWFMKKFKQFNIASRV